MGRPQEYSPKARLLNFLGYKLPFDRHDWIVDRCGREVKHLLLRPTETRVASSACRQRPPMVTCSSQAAPLRRDTLLWLRGQWKRHRKHWQRLL